MMDMLAVNPFAWTIFSQLPSYIDGSVSTSTNSSVSTQGELTFLRNATKSTNLTRTWSRHPFVNDAFGYFPNISTCQTYTPPPDLRVGLMSMVGRTRMHATRQTEMRLPN